jgi:hypothetical protein
MLEALSGQPATAMEYREFSRPVTLKRLVEPSRFDAALPNRVMVSRLRELVDEWMESGKNSDGELPSDRNLSRAPSALKAFECAGRQSSKPVFDPETNKFYIVFGINAAREFGIESPFNTAACIFTGLMYADWKNLLCKCRDPRCNRYFLRDSEITRRKKHGTFCCAEHQRRTRAIECITERRKKAAAELIKAAAAAAEELFTQGVLTNSWQTDAKQKLKLANLVNKHISSTVKVNWVSLHAGEIDQARHLRVAAGS